MKAVKILIPGEPGAIVREEVTVVWDNTVHRKCVASIELERQFTEEKFTKPIEINLKFFITPPKDMMQEKLIGRQHEKVPYISSLIRFITDACKGILYANEKIIYSVTAKKFYSINPRTEIYVKEKKENHESREQEIKELEARREKARKEKSYYR